MAASALSRSPGVKRSRKLNRISEQILIRVHLAAQCSACISSSLPPPPSPRFTSLLLQSWEAGASPRQLGGGENEENGRKGGMTTSPASIVEE